MNELMIITINLTGILTFLILLGWGVTKLYDVLDN